MATATRTAKASIFVMSEKNNNNNDNNFARAAHFFVHFLAVVFHDFNVKPSSNCPLSITLAFSA